MLCPLGEGAGEDIPSRREAPALPLACLAAPGGSAADSDRSLQVDHDLAERAGKLERHVVREVHRRAGVFAHIKTFLL
jgi:hypothetical protein